MVVAVQREETYCAAAVENRARGGGDGEAPCSRHIDRLGKTQVRGQHVDDIGVGFDSINEIFERVDVNAQQPAGRIRCAGGGGWTEKAEDNEEAEAEAQGTGRPHRGGGRRR